jgi:hypothetical protein
MEILREAQRIDRCLPSKVGQVAVVYPDGYFAVHTGMPNE